MPPRPSDSRVAIACGGTGGHLYPGLAVAGRLQERGAAVTLLVSEKEVDRRALGSEHRFRVVTLPAIGFSARRGLGFAVRFWRSLRLARREFRSERPEVLLSMGGFTSVPPALAARMGGGRVVLHEANAVPGRANRWLARIAEEAFVYFPEAASRLARRGVQVHVVGMPVREQFQSSDAGACRLALGLAPARPVLLVMGGSQGASGINEAVTRAAGRMVAEIPGLQILHLSGSRDEAGVREAYRAAGVPAVVRAFLTEMELALGAADVAIGRAGASSLAEIAAMGVPSLLVPFPQAADDHQTANAEAFRGTGAAMVIRQEDATPECLAGETVRLLLDAARREQLRRGLAEWHRPEADQEIAEAVLRWTRLSPSRTSAAADSAPAARPVSSP